MNYMEAAFAPATRKYQEQVIRDTWGHLAPVKGQYYHGHMVFTIGCYGSDYLNPTVIHEDFKGLEPSPWSYECIQDWLMDRARKFEVGCVYQFTGHMRNYRLVGKVKKIADHTKGK